MTRATLLLLTGSVMACAQYPSQPAPGARRVGVVNVAVAIENCAEYKNFASDLRRRFPVSGQNQQQLGREVNDLQEKLKQLEDRFGGPKPNPLDPQANNLYHLHLDQNRDAVIAYDGRVMNYGQLNQLLYQKAAAIQNSMQQFDNANRQAQAMASNAYEQIRKRMIQVIGAYGQNNGFSMVLDSGQVLAREFAKDPLPVDQVVLWAEQQVDITAEIIRAYDGTFGASGPNSAPGR